MYFSSKVLAGFTLFAFKSLSQSDAYWSNSEEASDQTNQNPLYHNKLLSKARWLSKNMCFLFPEGGKFGLNSYKKGVRTNISKF